MSSYQALAIDKSPQLKLQTINQVGYNELSEQAIIQLATYHGLQRTQFEELDESQKQMYYEVFKDHVSTYIQNGANSLDMNTPYENSLHAAMN